MKSDSHPESDDYEPDTIRSDFNHHTQTDLHDVPVTWITDFPKQSTQLDRVPTSQSKYADETTTTATTTKSPLPGESIENFARGLSRIGAVDPTTVQMDSLRECLYSESQRARSEAALYLSQKVTHDRDELPGGAPELFASLAQLPNPAITEWFALASKKPGCLGVLHAANRLFNGSTQSQIGLSDQILFEHDVMLRSIYHHTQSLPWKEAMKRALLNNHIHTNLSYSANNVKNIPKLVYIYMSNSFTPNPSYPGAGIERNQLERVIKLGETHEEKYKHEMALHIYSTAVSRIERSSGYQPDEDNRIPTAHTKCARMYMWKGHIQSAIDVVIQGREYVLQETIDNPQQNSVILQLLVEIFYETRTSKVRGMIHDRTGELLIEILSWIGLNHVDIPNLLTEFSVHSAKDGHLSSSDFRTPGDIFTEHEKHEIASVILMYGAINEQRCNNSPDEFTSRAASNDVTAGRFEKALCDLEKYEELSEYESAFHRLATVLREEHTLDSFENAIAEISAKRAVYEDHREDWDAFLEEYLDFVSETKGDEAVLQHLSRPETPPEVIANIISLHASKGCKLQAYLNHSDTSTPHGDSE